EPRRHSVRPAGRQPGARAPRRRGPPRPPGRRGRLEPPLRRRRGGRGSRAALLGEAFEGSGGGRPPRPPGDARCPRPPLPRYTADAPLAVSYTVADGTAELRILPGLPRPTRAERLKVEAAFAAWTPEIAAYLAAGERLWRYLDDHPERAEAALANVFKAALA